MADKTATYTYTGNPGYSFAFAANLQPGDVVQLTADQAAQAGDDFALVNDNPAPAADKKD